MSNGDAWTEERTGYEAQQKGENRDLTGDLEPRKKKSIIPQQEEDVEKTEDIEEKKKESESE